MTYMHDNTRARAGYFNEHNLGVVDASTEAVVSMVLHIRAWQRWTRLADPSATFAAMRVQFGPSRELRVYKAPVGRSAEIHIPFGVASHIMRINPSYRLPLELCSPRGNCSLDQRL